MADITMCRDEECKQKDTCYRFTAKASSFWQSYFMKSPREGNKCEHYWEIKEKKNV